MGYPYVRALVSVLKPKLWTSPKLSFLFFILASLDSLSLGGFFLPGVLFCQGDDANIFDPKTAQRFLLSPGDQFRVPMNNIYRLENHSEKCEAVIFWFIIKVSEFITVYSSICVRILCHIFVCLFVLYKGIDSLGLTWHMSRKC